ncbi:nucleotide sugar dehydrogenase [Aminipila sp.]|uniref:nucleotide sugar dehydrogenase n=1 Tax=Aminipila sp. TaxID=2060095 RepID=UPI001DEA2236|nr:nucleotide sugar dehydrogenase [Aminipila sp.]MBE6034889.1 nucleotide sugar dehydrogenase [Clostridiales bacterium]
MKINIIGLGYIGLPTALMLAASGLEVIGSDINTATINTLNKRELFFSEDGLSEVFNKALENKIKFQIEPANADVYIVAVPTPYEKDNKKINPEFVITAVKNIIEYCSANAIVVIESTVSPGTIDRYIRPIIQQNEKYVQLAHAPERIIPGNMINELVNNSRVIGVDNVEVGETLKEIYKNFCEGEIVITDIRSAEMVKVVENTYRDINIAFANELLKICRYDHMDVHEIIKIANMHPRVNILQPGPGVGGHCISVDPWFLVGDYPGLANIILAARKINDSMPEFVLERISQIMDMENIRETKKVGLYGLTYKEDVDDVRESPTLQLLDIMKKHLAQGISVYDPFVCEKIVDHQYLDFDRFIENIDLVVIMVGHSHLKTVIDKMKNKVVLDTRHVSADKQHKHYYFL